MIKDVYSKTAGVAVCGINDVQKLNTISCRLNLGGVRQYYIYILIV